MVSYCNVSKEQLCCHPMLLVPDLDYRTAVAFLISITWGKCSAVPSGDLGRADNTARENSLQDVTSSVDFWQDQIVFFLTNRNKKTSSMVNLTDSNRANKKRSLLEYLC